MTDVVRVPRARRRTAVVAIVGLVATLVSPMVATSAASAAAPNVAVSGGAPLTLTGPADMTLPKFVKTAAGGGVNGNVPAHGIGLTGAGQVYAWGDNAFGQLGPGATAAESVNPIAVPIPNERITDVVAGDGFTLALTSDGEVYAWGANRQTDSSAEGIQGSLGVATIESRATPAIVPGLPTIAQPAAGRSSIAAGLANGYALGTDGRVWSWGRNAVGELGRADTTSSIPSAGVMAASGNVMTGKQIVSIQAGARTAVARDANGSYYGWGANSWGALLNPTDQGSLRYPAVMYSYADRATAPGALAGRLIRSLSVNLSYGVAVTTDASGNNEAIVAWGFNSVGQLGDATEVNSPTPKVVDRTGTGMESERIDKISLGGGHVVALSSTGKVFTWGNNTNNILGRIATTAAQQRRPAQAANLPTASDIATGSTTTSVVTSTGRVTSVGKVTNGGVVTIGSGVAPEVVVDGVKLAASAVTGRTTNSVTITVPARARAGKVDVAVRAIGRQNIIRTAYTANLPAPTISSVTPAKAAISASSTTVDIQGSNFADGPRFNTVSSGETHAAALDTNGHVWVWGPDGSGYAGTGTSGAKPSPVQLPASSFGGRRIVQVEAANQHTIALADDGSVYSWGLNDFGQVGDRTSLSRSTPVLHDASQWPGKTIVAVATGRFNQLALASDGSVFSWGRNDSGTVGNGSATAAVTTPSLISAASFDAKRIVQVATTTGEGEPASYALAEDGTVYAWGNGATGRLGNGGTANTSVPGRVNFSASGAGAIVEIDAGDGFVRALDSSGTVVAWGQNDRGQLGDGSSTGRLTPVRIGDTGTFGGVVVDIDAGYHTAAVVLDNGSLLMNGWNRNGGLGNPALTPQSNTDTQFVSTPTRVSTDPVGAARVVSVGSSLALTAVLFDNGAGAGTGDRAVGTGSTAATNRTMAALDTKPLQTAGLPTITVDGTRATVVTRQSDTVIRATLPGRGSAAAGQFPLSLTAFDGQVATTGPAAFTFYGPPQAPTGVTSSIPSGQAGDSSVRLAWTAVANASLTAQNGYSPITKYVVQYREAGTSGAFQVASDGGTPLAVERTVTGLDTKKQYQFRVCSVNDAVSGVAETALAATCTATTSSTRPQFIELGSAVNPVTTSVTPSGAGGVTSTTTEVAVSTNNPAGYRLTVTAATASLAKAGSSDTIPAVPGTAGSPVSLAGSVYGWGYLADRASNRWAAVPTSGASAVVGSSTAPATAATTAVTYGFRVPATQPSGIYRGTITYTAVVN